MKRFSPVYFVVVFFLAFLAGCNWMPTASNFSPDSETIANIREKFKTYHIHLDSIRLIDSLKVDSLLRDTTKRDTAKDTGAVLPKPTPTPIPTPTPTPTPT